MWHEMNTWWNVQPASRLQVKVGKADRSRLDRRQWHELLMTAHS